MKEDPVSENRDFMLDYVINLLEDAMDFSWSSAKDSHAVLLCCMEQGKIGGWQEVEKIDRVRRAHAQRHTCHQSNMVLLPKSSPMFISIKIRVHRIKLMKQKVSCTNIYALLVGQVKARHTFILNLNVERKQKTILFMLTY